MGVKSDRELTLMERDAESGRGGYSSRSYIKALEEGFFQLAMAQDGSNRITHEYTHQRLHKSDFQYTQLSILSGRHTCRTSTQLSMYGRL